MSQNVQQVVGGQVVGNQVMQGQLVHGHVIQGQVVSGGSVVNNAGQVVLTTTSGLVGQQIVTRLVGGSQVQGAVVHQPAPGTTVVATSLPSSHGQTQIVQGQVGQQIQTVNHQMVGPTAGASAATTPAPAKPAAITQVVPPPSPSNLSVDSPTPVISKQRMTELVREVDPNEQLDEDVEEMLLSIADDFIESTVNAACRLAKHRNARTLDVKDVQMYLERNWHMWIPGFGTEELRPYKRAPTTEAHKQRLALIRKAIKKY